VADPADDRQPGASKGDYQVTTATTRPAAKQDRSTLALLFVAALVAVGGIGFAVGHLTAPGTTATNPGGNGRYGPAGGFQRPSLAPGESFNPGNFGGNNRGGFGGAGASIEGTVQSIDGSTLTIKLASGNTVTINLSGTTTYHNETSATAGDVTTGSTVFVQIETGAVNPGASGSPNPGASGAPGFNRTLTAKDVLITTP
jgi:hypothetical protein